MVATKTELSMKPSTLPTSLLPLPSTPLTNTLFARWEQLAILIPKLLAANALRAQVNAMPVITDLERHLSSEAEWQRAHLLLSFLSSAYIWGSPNYSNPSEESHLPVDSLPACLALPYEAVSRHFDIPPIISYAATVLFNYTLIDEGKPVSLENIMNVLTFTGSIDEMSFYLTSIPIEALGTALLSSLLALKDIKILKNHSLLSEHLTAILNTIKDIDKAFLRISEKVLPSAFFSEIRPYQRGFLNNDLLPNGVLYEGSADTSRRFYPGASAAQSPTIHALDAALAVAHNNTVDNPHGKYMDSMIDLIPSSIRPLIHFLADHESNPDIHTFLLTQIANAEYTSCINTYNACLDALAQFRTSHFKVVARYVMAPAASSANTSSTRKTAERGTGGTNPNEFLKTIREHTLAKKIALV